jgi:hypothetical protein
VRQLGLQLVLVVGRGGIVVVDFVERDLER